jgi:hypothetical protein
MLKSATTRLSAINSSMGGGSLNDGEYVLMTLPFPEPTAILDKLKKKHPNLTIVYRPIYFYGGTFDHQDKVPDGKCFPARTLSMPVG